MMDFTREMEPPPEIEERVVAALRRAGLVSPRSRAYPRGAMLRIAAALVLFAAGYAVGTRRLASVDPAEPSGPRFLLLLHRSAQQDASPAELSSRVAEYRDWARSIRERGIQIAGDRLKPTPDGSISGFFVIHTDSVETARQIAASCPHARLGNRVELREIDTPGPR
jgi:hypothetical protein